MAIETICSGCGKRLAVGDEFEGRRARCPSCGQIYTVPGTISAVDVTGGPATPPNEAPFRDTQSQAPGPTIGSASAPLLQPVEPIQYGNFWMKATNGQEYGPVDRATLDRWFADGRVGPGYQIRNSEFGDWLPAAHFQPATMPTGAPGEQPYQPTAGVGSFRRWPRADNSGVILALGILSWVTCFCIPFSLVFGVPAWIMGSQALKYIDAGQCDPTNRGMIQVGYYLGMVQVILALLGIALYVVLFAIGIVAR